jgi:hypothetical protein
MSEKAAKEHLPGITINPNMRDYSKDPFFVKKAERARALVAKYDLLKDDKPVKKAQ